MSPGVAIAKAGRAHHMVSPGRHKIVSLVDTEVDYSVISLTLANPLEKVRTLFSGIQVRSLGDTQ